MARRRRKYKEKEWDVVIDRSILHKTEQGFWYHYSPPNEWEIKLGRGIMKQYRLEKDDVIFNDRTQLSPFELDIYVPKLRRAWELQGMHHYQSIQVKATDELKRKQCRKLRIALIQIPIWKLK